LQKISQPLIGHIEISSYFLHSWLQNWAEIFRFDVAAQGLIVPSPLGGFRVYLSSQSIDLYHANMSHVVWAAGFHHRVIVNSCWCTLYGTPATTTDRELLLKL